MTPHTPAPGIGALHPAAPRPDRSDEAIEAARRAVRLEPHNPYRHDRVTWALLSAGGPYAEAAESARTALALAPDEADLWFSYALVQSRTGSRGEARRTLLHVLSLDPGHDGARHELAVLGSGQNLIGRPVTDPDHHRGRPELARTIRRFLHLSSVLLAVLAIGGFRFVQNDHPSAARWTVLAAVLVPVALAGWFAGRMTPASRRHLRPVVMTQLRAVALTTVSVALVAAALAGPDEWLSWLLGGAAIGGVLARVLTVGERSERDGVEIPWALGTAVLALITAACLVLSVLCLVAGTTLGQPALTVAGVLLTIGGVMTGRMIAKRGRIADSAQIRDACADDGWVSSDLAP